MFNRKLIQVAVALCIASPVYAAGPAVTAAPATVVPGGASQSDPSVAASVSRNRAEEIAATNERLGVLAARLAELEMQVKISSKLDELNKSKTSNFDTNDLPTVTGISGVDSVLKATLMLSNGRTQSARIGDMVGLWKITDIQMDSVTVKQGKQVVKLGFGSGQVAGQNQSLNRGVPAIPQQ